MTKIGIKELRVIIQNALKNTGMNPENAQIMADVYMRAALRGVGHHDLADLAGRLSALSEGRMNPGSHITKVSGMAALEVYDGDNAPGELCSAFVTRRSMALAETYGIGLATIRNSNHFLSAAPYTEMGEEEGFLTIVLSKSPGGLSLPGMNKNLMGNNPFGYAAGYDGGKLMLDICCSYSSYGKMQQMAGEGRAVPSHWGNDKDGRPTPDAAEIRDSGLYMPMGEHKGFGLALLVELLTSVLSGGAILNQEEAESGFPGKYSQSAVSIAAGELNGDYRQRTARMAAMLKEIHPEVYLPGERSVRVKSEMEEKGYLEVDEEILERIK